VSTAAFDAEQTDLATGRSGDRAGLALFADRVSARLGGAALAIPQLVASHLPERAVALRPFAEVRTPDAARMCEQAALPERPIRLFARPEPIEVAAAQVPEGPPQRFRWRRVLYRVVSAEGPERIAAEWWRE